MYIQKKVLLYNNADIIKMNQIIENIDWVSINEQEDVNGFNAILVNTINKAIDDCIPTKKITVRPNDKPWMSNEIRVKLRQRNRIHRKAEQSNNSDHWANFRNIRNEVISLIRTTKELYMQKLEQSLNNPNISSSKWWKTARTILKVNNKSSIIPPLNHNGDVLFHPLDKAECLVDYFSTISTSSDNIDPLPPVPESPNILNNIIF